MRHQARLGRAILKKASIGRCRDIGCPACCQRMVAHVAVSSAGRHAPLNWQVVGMSCSGGQTLAGEEDTNSCK